MGVKRAVLVGCNYPNTQYELHGCVNDVKAMYSLLTSKFGFSPNDVPVLVDTDPQYMQPTGINIKRALTAMVRSAGRGDNLVFHYSGHGTLVPQSREGIRESAIVPTDMNLICDDDLHEIVEPLASGAKFTFIADCCHSGGMLDEEEDYVVGSNKPNPSRPSEEETSAAPGGLVGMIISQVLNKAQGGGGAQHHSGGGLLTGLVEKFAGQALGLNSRELPSESFEQRELPPEATQQSRGLDFFEGEGHHKKHHHKPEEGYGEQGYGEGGAVNTYGEGAYSGGGQYGQQPVYGAAPVYGEGREEVYGEEGRHHRRRPEEGYGGEYGEGEGRRHHHQEEVVGYGAGYAQPYGAQAYPPPQEGQFGACGGGGYGPRPGFEPSAYGESEYVSGPPGPSYGGYERPSGYGQAPAAYGQGAPAYGEGYSQAGGYGQGRPPIADNFHEDYTGRVHQYPYGTHQVVKNRSLPADVLAQVLSQKLGSHVSVDTIRTGLNALFGGDSSTMVQSAVQLMHQLGGGGGGGGGMLGGMMGGLGQQGPVAPDINIPMKKGVGILITGCTRDETSADADPSGNPQQAFGALSNAIQTIISQSPQPLTNRQLVLAVREYLAKAGFEQHPCLECTPQLGETPFIMY